MHGTRWALVSVLMLLLAVRARADLAVNATVSPQRAEVGEPMVLSIEVKGAQDIAPPALGNIDGIDVQYLGPSTQVAIINGQVNASVQHRYSLTATRPGRFTLGPFTIAYQGKTYRTAALAVDVVAAAAQGQGGAAAGATPGAPGLRLTLAVPPGEVYLHQRLPIDITLYVPTATRVADLQYPSLSADGLSVDKIPEPTQRQQVIDGQAYQLVHFQTSAIPLRAGSLVLGPATLRLNLLSRRRGVANDPFFQRFFAEDPFATERRPMEVRSEAVTLNVLPLPEDGKPATFSGAVGQFTLQVSAAPTELNAGDPITLHMAVSGTGNLADAGAPELINAGGFRTYEPRVVKGDNLSKIFEQVLMPNDAKVAAVPSVRFSYFDPQSRRYATLESQPIALVVRAPQGAAHPEIVGGEAPQRAAAPEQLGRDIVYIKDDPGPWSSRSRPWYGSLFFLLWQPVPLGLLAAAIWYDRRRQRLAGDRRFARFSQAAKTARRGLASAAAALAANDRAAFYDAVSRSMQEYLGAKLDLPLGGIDVVAIDGCGLPAACTQRIRAFFDICEQVRFAPGSGDGDMRGTLALAQEIVRTLERERRLRSRAVTPVRGAA